MKLQLALDLHVPVPGRSPRGERGLKLFDSADVFSAIYSRSPRGERGLKLELDVNGNGLLRRSPRGERGLKFDGVKAQASLEVSVAPREGSVD